MRNFICLIYFIIFAVHGKRRKTEMYNFRDRFGEWIVCVCVLNVLLCVCRVHDTVPPRWLWETYECNRIVWMCSLHDLNCWQMCANGWIWEPTEFVAVSKIRTLSTYLLHLPCHRLMWQIVTENVCALFIRFFSFSLFGRLCAGCNSIHLKQCTVIWITYAFTS